MRVWPYVAAFVGALLLVLGLGRRLQKRKTTTDALGVGKLSDAWLAERRRGPDPE
jgi:hypothetical protein